MPDDIEEDEESMDRKYWQFRQNFATSGGGDMLDKDMNSQNDQQRLINKLMGVAQQRLLELLKEYGEVKQKKSP